MNVNEVCLKDTANLGLWNAQKDTIFHLGPATNVGFGVHVLAGLRMGRQPFSWPSEINFRL